MTAQLDRAMVELRKEFKLEIEAGIISHIGTQGDCRRKNHKAGAPYSEHAWPGGNAADVHVRNKATGDAVAKWMRQHPELWSEVYWQIALHYDHVHGTANPRMNYDNQQIPPCAGGSIPEPEETYMFSEPGQSGPVQEYWNRTFAWLGYATAGSLHDSTLSNAVKDLVGGNGNIGPREMLNINLIVAERQAKKFGKGSTSLPKGTTFSATVTD